MLENRLFAPNKRHLLASYFTARDLRICQLADAENKQKLQGA
jgi:hypothetical protein